MCCPGKQKAKITFAIKIALTVLVDKHCDQTAEKMNHTQTL